MKAEDQTQFDQSFTAQRYASLIAEHGSDSIVVTGCDGYVVWSNPAFSSLSGYALEEMVGRKPGDILQGGETDPATVEAISKAVSERRPIRTEILNYTKSGTPYWIELNITPIFDEDGKHTHFMSIERDVTSRKELEKQARISQAREELRRDQRQHLSLANEWLHATKSLKELLTVVRKSMSFVAPNSSGALYLYSNSRDVLDLSCEWGDTDYQEHIEPDDCWALRRGRPYIYGLTDIEFSCPHQYNLPDHPSICIPILAHGDTIGLMTLTFDKISIRATPREEIDAQISTYCETALACSEQISLAIANVQLRQQLQDQSVRDQLTDLWNRRWFTDFAHRELNRAAHKGQNLSLISVDADHFKRFNDQHGHDAGDMVLKQISGIMREVFGTAMPPCRIGGEEFVIVAPETDADKAFELTERFREKIADHQIIYQDFLLPRITISAGIASFPEDGDDLSTLMRSADHALYAAKKGGRNLIVLRRDMKKTDRERANVEEK